MNLSVLWIILRQNDGIIMSSLIFLKNDLNLDIIEHIGITLTQEALDYQARVMKIKKDGTMLAHFKDIMDEK